MKIPLLDLRAQYNSIREEIKKAIEELLESQQFILGPKVEELEKRIASYCGTRFAVGVSSGTDALLLSLMAIGIERDDIVITTPYTFFSTAGSISRLGAIPKFVDIEISTYNLDPVRLEEFLSDVSLNERKKIKAIIPVHLFGQCADMENIIKIADRYNVAVIEDAAQALGASCKIDNRVKKAGSIGMFGCFSFFPSKNLGGYGDGGMVITSEERYADLVRILRVHGSKPKYYHHLVGCNARLDAIQAAILLVKFSYLETWTEKRRKNAIVYNRLFSDERLLDIVTLPIEQNGNRHVFNQYVIRVPERDKLREFLSKNGIGTEIYYPVPLHLQPCYKDLGYREGDFPCAEKAAKESLALPVFPELSIDKQEYIVKMIKKFYH